MSLRIIETPGKIVRTKEANEERSRIRVHVFADNSLVQEQLLRAFDREQEFDAIRRDISEDGGQRKFASSTLGVPTEILVMFSCAAVYEDLRRVRQARKKTPSLKVLLVGGSEKEGDFLQYVRGGVNGFRPAEASAGEIVAAVRTVCSGKVVCGNAQCEILFRYFEKESEAVPSAAMRRDLGFTRREQQMVPLLTRGLTNKEIANHFSLSEQTVKNHLYRMKRKIGAGDRLEIVDVCRRRGFLA